MMETQLPALIVVTPLLVGLGVPFVSNVRAVWGIATLTAFAVLGMALSLLGQVNTLVAASGNPSAFLSYAMGNWQIPWGIEYRVDPLNAFVVLIIALVAAVVTFYARLSIEQEIPGDRIRFFYAVWLLFITGLLGVTMTGDVFNVYVLLEISSLTSYVLIAMGKYHDRKALSASINYLILGTIGASFFLLGVGYLYSATGTLNMADMADKLSPLHDNRTVITAVVFLVIGLSIKMALFPLHGWLPNAHGYAPPIVSALLSAVTIKVSAYVLIRFLFSVLGPSLSFNSLPIAPLLLLSASFAILVGSYLAIQQATLKRLLAYSSVAQIGYIGLGFGLANEHGLTGALIHIFNHALTKGGLFLVSGIIVYRFGATDLAQLRGLGRRMPWTMAAFTAGGLGLIGVPLTAGFISKWYLVTGAMEKGLSFLPLIILLGSLLAVMYVWKIVELAYFQTAEPSGVAGVGGAVEQTVEEEPWSLVLPAWVLIGASVYFGIDASVSSWLAKNAAQVLLRAG